MADQARYAVGGTTTGRGVRRWRGFRFLGTDEDLARENRAHAAVMARRQRVAADLQRAVLLAKGRC